MTNAMLPMKPPLRICAIRQASDVEPPLPRHRSLYRRSERRRIYHSRQPNQRYCHPNRHRQEDDPNIGDGCRRRVRLSGEAVQQAAAGVAVMSYALPP